MQKKPIRRQTLTDLFHNDGCDAHQDLLSLALSENTIVFNSVFEAGQVNFHECI